MKYAKWISAWVLLAVPLIATAQMTLTERITTQVPFKFMVGGAEMPAGECIVQLANETGDILTLRNPEAKRTVYVLTVPDLGRKSEKAAMVFRRYGDRYFLAELRVEDSRTVYTLQPTKLEKEFRAHNIPVQDILVASR
jgi:hypothetical protein